MVSPLRIQQPQPESLTMRQVQITGTDLNDGVATQDAAALVRVQHTVPMEDWHQTCIQDTLDGLLWPGTDNPLRRLPRGECLGTNSHGCRYWCLLYTTVSNGNDGVIDDTTARCFTNSKNCIQRLMLQQHLTNGNIERHLGMLFMIQQQTVQQFQPASDAIYLWWFMTK